MYIKRSISELILAGSQDSPVISIVGPRQSGKSTLSKQLFPHHAYVDMQEPSVLEFALSDPKGFLQTYTNEYGIIIDEAQYAPILFDQIKVEVDRNKDAMGRYILTGSQHFLLSEKITESLAGRVYLYKLLPLSFKELADVNRIEPTIEQQIIKGFYPNLYDKQKIVHTFYESYFYTYVERDVRSLRNIGSIGLFKKFIQLCIARIGQPLNFTSLANETGISIITVRAWLSLLEASFIIYLLPSFHTNLSKRIVKSPKLYFYDTGLAADIAGITFEMLKERRDLVGSLFENMIITDIMKECINQGLHHQLFFFRDNNLKEIDLIIDLPGTHIPVEIKASMTLQSSFFDSINWLSEELKLKNKNILIYGGNQIQHRTTTTVLPWNKTYELFDVKK
jgi:predicted AAA+ superfamily ATPase